MLDVIPISFIAVVVAALSGAYITAACIALFAMIAVAYSNAARLAIFCVALAGVAIYAALSSNSVIFTTISVIVALAALYTTHRSYRSVIADRCSTVLAAAPQLKDLALRFHVAARAFNATINAIEAIILCPDSDTFSQTLRTNAVLFTKTRILTQSAREACVQVKSMVGEALPARAGMALIAADEAIFRAEVQTNMIANIARRQDLDVPHLRITLQVSRDELREYATTLEDASEAIAQMLNFPLPPPNHPLSNPIEA